eukprot:gb/GEZN01009448.1/.p1 GENE.gb/GEZN01009448.1/~~gb/GEZN01009448.1/.p1  ORF type:complete len:344 (-),score=44.63 gb/GEZN01009448.1/:169-1200(-)
MNESVYFEVLRHMASACLHVRGADFPETGGSLFHYACSAGATKLLALLFQAGARVDKGDKNIGATGAWYAARSGQKHVLWMLVAWDFNPFHSAFDSFGTPCLITLSSRRLSPEDKLRLIEVFLRDRRVSRHYLIDALEHFMCVQLRECPGLTAEWRARLMRPLLECSVFTHPQATQCVTWSAIRACVTDWCVVEGLQYYTLERPLFSLLMEKGVHLPELADKHVTLWAVNNVFRPVLQEHSEMRTLAVSDLTLRLHELYDFPDVIVRLLLQYIFNADHCGSCSNLQTMLARVTPRLLVQPQPVVQSVQRFDCCLMSFENELADESDFYLGESESDERLDSDSD